MYVSQAWSVAEVSLLVTPPSTCELLAVVDKTSGHCWIIVYRPPDVYVGDTQLLCRALVTLLALHPNATILGDFNFSKITWAPVGNYTPTTVDSISMEFLETVWAAWDLVQLVQWPSRGKNYLNLIFTSHINNYDRVASSGSHK